MVLLCETLSTVLKDKTNSTPPMFDSLRPAQVLSPGIGKTHHDGRL